MRTRLALLSTLALLTALLVAPATSSAAQHAPDAAPIRLAAATFTPALGEQPDVPPGLTIAGYAPGVRGYYIVQFAGPVHEHWKDAVAAAGAELLDYLPDYAFKVRMNPAQAARVEGLADVAWVGFFEPAFKLSPAIDRSGPALYRVRIERGAGVAAAEAAVAASGAAVLGRQGRRLLVAADSAQLDAVAHVLDVAWVEPFAVAEKHNEYGGGFIVGSATANAGGYDGSTQTVAVADTGIGDGTAAGAHPDIPAGRVTSIHNWPGMTDTCFASIDDDGAQDVDSGHGTHTAVSAVGDGGAAGEGKGAAPAANLVFQATENWAVTTTFCKLLGLPDGYYLIGLPADLRNLYQQAYADGARIHSNSWGSDQNGAYTTDSANTDDFIWDNPDMAITFSAGNSGTDANANGVVDDDSIGSPATAKNVITVGASENDRADDWPCDTGLGYTSHDAYQPGETCTGMGGQNLLGTWGQRYPSDFPADPLASDVTAGNSGQMASWSSRGPTDDGRIKPDVVAPGTWILSGYSSLYQEGYGDPVNPKNGVYQWDGWGMPFDDAYKYMGGTSMSNPIVAGAAAVVRDFYQKTDGHGASAALVKATLINSAIDMLDENNDGANDNDFPIPNVHEGWGRISLAKATDGSHIYVDDAVGVGTGGASTHQVSNAVAGSPLRITLVWSDFASTEAAETNLVNDLDLVVTAPGGAQYRGNVFSGGWSLSGGSADAVNNVENVYVQSPAAGTWTIEVQGPNVPQGGTQPFALVIDGELGVQDTPPAVTLESPAEGAVVSGTWPVVIDATDAEDAPGSLTVEWNVGGGAWQAAPWNSVTGRYEAFWVTTAVSDGGHTVTARATDSAANATTDVNAVTVANEPAANSHIGDLDGFSTSAKKNWTATVVVTVHDSAEGLVAGATVNGTWSGGFTGPGSCTTDASGTCMVTSGEIPKKTAGATFTVNGIAHATLTYDMAANHDPDGDFPPGGNSIVVAKDAGDPPPPDADAHIGDLDGASDVEPRNRWVAFVTVTVHDEGHQPVAGATVTGSWSSGASGSSSCDTLADGTCLITKGRIKANSASATFTVASVAHPAYAYVAAANHDPDGPADSDGTTIVVLRP